MAAENSDNYISLQEATKFCQYTQEYLSLRARQGKLKAVKFGRNWVTKREWLEEYLKKIKEYNNQIATKKLKRVEPPAELERVIALEKYPEVQRREIPTLRFGFVVALIVTLLITGIVFGKPGSEFWTDLRSNLFAFGEQVQNLLPGKDSFLNVFQDLDPYVRKISQATDLAAKEIFRDTKSFYGSIPPLVAQINKNFTEGLAITTENLTVETRLLQKKVSTNLKAQVDDINKEIARGILQVNERVGEVFANTARSIENWKLKIGNSLNYLSSLPKGFAESFDRGVEQGIKKWEEVREMGQIGLMGLRDFQGATLEKVSSYTYIFILAEISQSSGEIIKDYFSWLARLTFGLTQKIVESYSSANQFVEQKLGGLAETIISVPGKIAKSYWLANDWLEEKISRAVIRILEGYTFANNFVEKKLSQAYQTITQPFIRGYQFVTQPWQVPKIAPPEKVATEKVIEKEIIKEKEVERITKIEPIREIEKITEITKIDDKELAKIKSQLAQFTLWGTDIENLREITKKLQAHPSQTPVPTAPIYIGSQGLQVGGAITAPSLGVPGLAGIETLGVRSATIGSDSGDKLNVNATALFISPVTVENTFKVGGATNYLTISSNGNLTTTGNISVSGNLTVSGTQNLVGPTTISYSGTSTALTVTQNGTGDIVQFLDGENVVLRIADGGQLTLTSTSTPQLTVRYDEGKYLTTSISSAGETTITGSATTTLSTVAGPLILTPAGYVGIGTSTPATALTVYGTTTIMGGNVGIGTTAPDGKLTVSADRTSWGEGVVVNPATTGYGAIFFRKTAGDYTGTWFVGKLPSSDNFAIVRQGLTGMTGTSRRDAPFEIKWSDGTAIFGGNVGIGTTTPSSLLHVQPAASTTVPFYVQYRDSTNTLQPGIYVKEDGNVGIGTTNPGQKLDVQDGNIRLIRTSAVDHWLVYKPSGTLSASNPQWNVGQLADAKYTIRSWDGTNSIDRLTINTDGNVGIGTTEPASKLEVSGGTGSVNLKLTADTDNSGEGDQPSITLSQDGGAVLGQIGFFDSENAFSIYNTCTGSGCDLQLGAGNRRKDLVINASTGNVGIGTTNPGGYKLNVAGATYLGGNIGTGGNMIELSEGLSGNRYSYIDFHGDDTYTDYGLRIIRYNTGPNAHSCIHHRGTGILELYTQESGSHIVLYPGGNVGIRTTLPTNILTIVRYSSTDPIADAWTTYSTPDSKIILGTADEEAMNYLEIFKNLPVYKWKRTEGEPERLSVIAVEETPSQILSYGPDGEIQGIDLQGYIGFLHEVMKAQQNQIEEIKLQLDSLGSLTLANATPSIDGIQENGETSIFSQFVERVKQALSSLGLFIENGIAKVKELFAEKVSTKEICLEGEDGETICIDKEQLKNLLENQNSSFNSVSSGGGGSSGASPEETIYYYYDGDGDGYGTSANFVTSPQEGYVADNTDCDDSNAQINPSATEICDEIDNDCDGLVDEDNVCQTEPTQPICDSSHLNLCLTETDCLAATGFWYNETCNSEPEVPVCTPNWSCSEWQPLPETIACGTTFTQTRTCTDLNKCDTDEGKPAEEQEAVGVDATTCGTTSCDTNLNLIGECQNACLEGSCQPCTSTCTCAEGFADCDNDMTNGCEYQLETATSTCPTP